MTNEVGLWLLIFSVVGGGVGALATGSPAWKGAVVVLFGIAIDYAIISLAPDVSMFGLLAAGMIAMAACGGALQMHMRSILATIFGSLVSPYVALLIAGTPLPPLSSPSPFQL